MKKFKMNRMLLGCIGLLIAVALFVVGRDHEAGSAVLLNAGAMVSLSDVEKEGFSDQEQKVILAVKKLTTQLQDQVKKGAISKDDISSAVSGIKMELEGGAIKSLQDQLKELEEVAQKQGTSLGEISERLSSNQLGSAKSIADVLQENKEELRKIYNQGSGTKQFMVGMNSKGQMVMRPFDPTAKAAGPHATVDNVTTGGNVASIAQSIDAATLLRMGGNSPIVSQFRNTPWIFDLCNLQNAGLETPFAMWFEETAKQGASATVAEGGTKPATQYAYELKTATYKKEATLIGITDEFSIDFARLESDILGKGRTDVINRINTAILANIISNATAYNTSASFNPGSGDDLGINVNDFDAIAAMAAQVDSTTFGNMANAAVMSTYKKYRMGLEKNTLGDYLNRPGVIDNINFVGNPAMGTDDILVGDFKNYNIILKGGLIVKVGYNGTDFAENKFSIVMEQYYFDYISTIRKAGIVKGTTFAAVKQAIGDYGS
jgi:hypothetical protein